MIDEQFKETDKETNPKIVRINTTISSDTKKFLAEFRIKYADIMKIGVDAIQIIINKIKDGSSNDDVKAFIDLFNDPTKKILSNISMTTAVFSSLDIPRS